MQTFHLINVIIFHFDFWYVRIILETKHLNLVTLLTIKTSDAVYNGVST